MIYSGVDVWNCVFTFNRDKEYTPSAYSLALFRNRETSVPFTPDKAVFPTSQESRCQLVALTTPALLQGTGIPVWELELCGY